MNYSNDIECSNYILLRLHMILRNNFFKFKTILYKNILDYQINIIIYQKNKDHIFKINGITQLVTKDEIEDTLLQLLENINNIIN